METLEELLAAYQASGIEQVQDYAKFSQYALVHHSTAIEGSTLTETETQLLLDEGLSPKGKPMVHALMVQDHYAALQFVLQAADETLNPSLIQQVNARVMQRTGAVYETALGRVDASRGELRKGNVRAGNRYFMNYDQVLPALQNFCRDVEAQAAHTLGEQLNRAWAAHYALVTIHPFYDGNGRTARLVMNLLQRHAGLPLSVVHPEDRADYFNALEAARAAGELGPFFAFMEAQYRKQLRHELGKYAAGLKG